MLIQVSLPGDKYKSKLNVEQVGKRLEFAFGFNKKLMEEVKTMKGAKWHGYDAVPRKIWSVENCRRNAIALDILQGNFDRYFAVYDKPYDIKPKGQYSCVYRGVTYTPREYQLQMSSAILTTRRTIIAGEMGTGKTLATMIAMLESGVPMERWLWVGIKASVDAFYSDHKKWKILPQTPQTTYYTRLKKLLEEWPAGKPAPLGIVFDEASKVKNPGAQCTQAAAYFSEQMWEEHQGQEYVIELTGTPSPKNPGDWFSLLEIAAPGFIREGDKKKFEARLSINKQSDGMNGVYNERVSWLDNENRCKICGVLKESHGDIVEAEHLWTKSKNEVAFLYERMKGLVHVYLKKDYLKELPDKIYQEIELQPSSSILRVARSIARTAPNYITAMTRLRELSDGFQYQETKSGKEKCKHCEGTRKIKEYKTATQEILEDTSMKYADPKFEIVDCPDCDDNGEVDKYIRTTKEVETPKTQALIDLLDQYEEVGRLVIYAGFTGSIDKIVKICQKECWHVIRVDARGWYLFSPTGEQIDACNHIEIFQEWQDKYPNIAFVAQSGSAGMGITLTASQAIVYWSNDFNADNRIQSEDRIHRFGMDLNKGATIYDLIHLESDRHCLENLKAKRDMQALTMGDFSKLKTCFGADVAETEETTERVF